MGSSFPPLLYPELCLYALGTHAVITELQSLAIVQGLRFLTVKERWPMLTDIEQRCSNADSAR